MQIINQITPTNFSMEMNSRGQRLLIDTVKRNTKKYICPFKEAVQLLR